MVLFVFIGGYSMLISGILIAVTTTYAISGIVGLLAIAEAKDLKVQD